MDENGDDRYCGKCFIGKINSYEVLLKKMLCNLKYGYVTLCSFLHNLVVYVWFRFYGFTHFQARNTFLENK